jgi:type IV pilus assembly protein PilC
MRRGALRSELEALEADLARGTPLTDALKPRQLPELYKRMVAVGAQSQDLPGVLTILADHYQEQHLLWTRLRGLMTYPLLVLGGVFALSLGFHLFVRKTILANVDSVYSGMGIELPQATQVAMPLLTHSWVFPLGFGLLLAAAILVLFWPPLQNPLRWRVPAFREAGLSRIAGTFALLLERAVPLPEAVALVEQMESHSVARQELASWRARLAQGIAKFSEAAAGGRVFPPLFVWLAGNAGAGLAEGFRQAAAIYGARSTARSEMMLHAALPVAVLTLGVVVAMIAFLMVTMFLPFVKMMDAVGG